MEHQKTNTPQTDLPQELPGEMQTAPETAQDEQVAPVSSEDAETDAPMQPVEILQAEVQRHMKRFDMAAARAAQLRALAQYPGDLAVLAEAADLDAMRCDFPAFIDKVTRFEQATGEQHTMHSVLEAVEPLHLPDLHLAAEAAYAYLRDHVPAGTHQMTGIAVQPGKVAIAFEFMLSKERVAEINRAVADIVEPLLGDCADRFSFLCMMSNKYTVRELARAMAAMTILKLKLGVVLRAALADADQD